MGFPIPPPPVIGANCAVCDGTLWNAGETPRFIHVTFADLVKCFGAPLTPPNAIWVLEQDAIDPCKWVYEDNKFRVVVEVGVGQVEVGCVGRGAGAGSNFFAGQGGGCSSDFNNIYVVCVGNIEARFGTAHIDWE